MADEQPPPPHLQTVKLSTVIHRIVEKSYNELIFLSESLRDKPDQTKKITLRDYFDRTRHRFLRLLVLVKWSSQVSSVKKCWEIQDFLNRQDSALRDAADTLYWVKDKLKQSQAPNYDIPTAIDVLTTGSYNRLPMSIKNLVPPKPITPEEERSTLEKLNDVINMRLLTVTGPPMLDVKVEEGRAICSVRGEFEVSLTVEGEAEDLPWKLGNVEVFVSESEKGGAVSMLPPSHEAVLRDLLQRRMAVALNPLEELYTVMHAFCLPLQLDILNTQAQALSKSRAGAIKVEFTAEEQLVIFYWRELIDNQPDAIYLKISIEKNQLLVTHNPPLRDPTTGQEAKLNVCSTSLNVEQLLVRAMDLHIHLLLSKLISHLESNASLLSSTLHCERDFELIYHKTKHPQISGSHWCTLIVKLVDQDYLEIAVDPRKGRYLLYTTTTIDSDLLKFMEVRINRDPSEILAIVEELRKWKERSDEARKEAVCTSIRKKRDRSEGADSRRTWMLEKLKLHFSPPV